MRKRLSDVKVGEKVKILEVNVRDDMRRRFMDIGMIPGTVIECVMCSPFNEPYAYDIRGTLMAIRCEDTSHIIVSDIND